MQGSSVMNSYTLVWWQAKYAGRMTDSSQSLTVLPYSTWSRPNSFYQILYSCLGISQALFTFGV